MSRILASIARPFDQRFDLTDRLHRNLLDKPVPAHARRVWYCFGGLTFFVFVLQVLSGVFLTMYYQPTPERAYASVFYISHYVHYGWLIRSIHVWGAHLMVVFIVIHMLRVFLTASYKNPREFNWVAGVFLFVVTMGFGLTGYLLPWDQKAYWGSTVTISLIKQVPLVGNAMAGVVMGGEAIGAPTLTRFYSGHVFLLPAALGVLLVMHFWMIRKQGISGPL
ncbi:MAG: cytochrome b N-terminal domain-containing protein [Coriobacteriia bacterium]|nr:cytochrome b N-terminal domain-containing protein [Coriobacteriia bacterium]